MRTLDAIDLFQRGIPSFNIKGRTFVSSLPGGIFSLIIFSTMIFYASVKFVHLVSRHNPTVSSYKNEFFFDASEEVDLYESSVHFAFGVEGYVDGELKDDSKFVKYLVRMYGKIEGEKFERFVTHHECTADDLDLMGKPAPESAHLIEQYKARTNGKRLFCLDQDQFKNGEPLSVWGTEYSANYQRFEFILAPCNYVHS